MQLNCVVTVCLGQAIGMWDAHSAGGSVVEQQHFISSCCISAFIMQAPTAFVIALGLTGEGRQVLFLWGFLQGLCIQHLQWFGFIMGLFFHLGNL